MIINRRSYLTYYSVILREIKRLLLGVPRLYSELMYPSVLPSPLHMSVSTIYFVHSMCTEYLMYSDLSLHLEIDFSYVFAVQKSYIGILVISLSNFTKTIFSP